MVPYADWNLLKFPDKDAGDGEDPRPDDAVGHLPDRLPRRVHRGRRSGSTVYVAGAGPVGLAAAHSAQLLGAAVVFVGDLIPERLAQAKSFGCEPIDVTKGELPDQIEEILGVPEVDAAVDCVGFEARGHGKEAEQRRRRRSSTRSWISRARRGELGIPGLYVTGDPGGVDDAAKKGSLSIRIGLGWAKSHSFNTGQCPVMKYNPALMPAILHDKMQIAKAVNATVISLDNAPRATRTSTRARPRSSSSIRTGWSRPGGPRVGDFAAVRPRGSPRLRSTSCHSPGPAAWPRGRAARPRGRRRGPSSCRSASTCREPSGPLKTISMRPSAGRTVARG